MNSRSLEDAYEVVRLHLTGSGGLMSQVEQGLEIDVAHVQELERAMERIATEWRTVSVVPKQIVQLFCDLFPRLEQRIQLSTTRTSELRDLYYRFGAWIDRMFAEEPLSEEAAITIVNQQIGGLQPLALELRFNGRLEEGSLELFYLALDTLAEIWPTKKNL